MKGKGTVKQVLKRCPQAQLWGLINRHRKKKNDSYNNLPIKCRSGGGKEGKIAQGLGRCQCTGRLCLVPELEIMFGFKCKAAGKIEQRIMFGLHVLNRTSACSWCCQIKRNGYIYTGKGVFNTLNTHTHTERGYTCTLAESIHSRFLNLLLWRAAVALLSISWSLIPHFSHASSFPFYCQCRSSWCGRKAQPWLSALKTTGEILTLPKKTKQNKTTTKKQPLRRSSPC